MENLPAGRKDKDTLIVDYGALVLSDNETPLMLVIESTSLKAIPTDRIKKTNTEKL